MNFLGVILGRFTQNNILRKDSRVRAALHAGTVPSTILHWLRFSDSHSTYMHMSFDISTGNARETGASYVVILNSS